MLQIGELRAVIATDAGVVTFDPATTPSAALRDLLLTFNQGLPLVISEAALAPADSSEQLVITGIATLFGAAMPVVARLMSDGAEDVLVRFEFTTPEGWQFASAFPHMPGIVDYSQPQETPPAPLLDLLAQSGALADAAFVLSSHAGRDDARGADLATGWNVACRFVGARASGYLGAVLAGRELQLAGALTPVNDAVTPSTGGLPAPGLPGIMLSGDAGDLSVGHLPLKSTTLVIYTPIDGAWAGRHGDYPPVVGLHGELHAGSALIVPAEILTPIGADSLLARVAVAAATVPDLADNAGLTGADDLHKGLPADLLKLVQGLGPLRVQEIALGLQRTEAGGQTVDYMGLGLSLHDLRWPVIPGLVELESVDTILYVDEPLKAEQRRVGAHVSAALELDGYQLAVRGQLPSGALVAGLAEGTTIPLGAVLARHLPGVVPPGALTVSELLLSAMPAPTSSYMIRATLDEQLTIPLGHLDLKLDQTTFNLSYQNGGAAGALVGWVEIAGAGFYASASHPQPGAGWQFAGGLGDGQTLRLAELVAELLPGPLTLPEALQQIQLEQLALTWDTQSGEFTLLGQASTAWDLQLGPRAEQFIATLEIRSMPDATGGRSTTGRLAGQLNLDGTVFELRYDFRPGEQILSGEWLSADKPLDHTAVGNIFSADLSLPEGVPTDLHLTRLSFVLDVSKGGGDSFVLEGDSAHYGDAYCLLQRDAAQQWTMALLVALPEGKVLRPSDLPLVGAELGVLDFLSLDSAFFLVVSRDIAALPLPRLGGITLSPVRVVRGLQLGAVVDFTGEGSYADERKNLRGLLKRDAVLMQISVGADVVLVAELEGELVFDDQDPGNTKKLPKKLRLFDPTLIIKAVPIEFTLRGGIQVRLKDDVIDASGFITIGPEEATCAFDLAAEQGSLPYPMGLPGIHLAELGVAMGMVFEPPQLELGLQGNFFIGEPPPGPRPVPARRDPGVMPPDNQFVIILGMIDVIPNPLLLSMYLARVDLATIIAAFTDQAPHLPELLMKISASDLLLYWCDEPIQQPNGLWINPGFGFTASLDIWGFPAHADLKIDLAGRQISGNASIAPVDIDGVIQLHGAGEGSPPQYTGSQVVPAHGAFVHFNTAASPYLLASADLTLFNTFHQAVQAQVTHDGFNFTIAYRVGEVFTSDLSCLLAGHKHFRMAFDIALELDLGPVTVGSIHLGRVRLGETGFHALLDAQLTNELDLTLTGGFTYDGHELNLPQVRLEETPQSLEHLPKLIRDEVLDAEKEILKAIYDEAELILNAAKGEAEVLWKAWEDEEQWMLGKLKHDLEVAEAAIVQEVGQIEREGEDAVNKIRHEAEVIIADVQKGLAALDRAMSAAETEIHRLAQESAAEAERVAQAAARDLAAAAQAVAQVVSEAAAKVKTWVKEAGRDVKHFFKHIF